MQVNEAYEPAFHSSSRYLVLKGGAGSGKSIFASQKVYTRIVTEPGHRILCLRKVANTLRNSIYENFQSLLSSENTYSDFVINKSEMRFTHIDTGNEIILAGLDDAEKIKSIAGITSVWCEEVTEFLESDFNQIELRVRGETLNYKQFILSFNPIDENHWIKKRFFDNTDPDAMIVESTYADNAFLDQPYIDHLVVRLKSNENLYRIYVKNEWGRAQTGWEFYKCFRFTKHVGPTKYDPAIALHVSFDFNVNPYMTATIWQIKGKNATQIDEVCLADPNNTTPAVCREIVRRYPGHTSGMFIYGDPGGRQEDTRSEKGSNDYRLILSGLHAYKPALRVSHKAPPVVMRGNFINTVFEANYGGINITIDAKCKRTIDDYTYLKQASDGTKHKEKAKDETTNVSYEKFGHTSDANDYFLTYAFVTDFEAYQRGNVNVRAATGKIAAKHGY